MAVACPFCGGPMDYLTVGQVASILNVSKKTVRKYIVQGRFPGTELVHKVDTRSMYKIPVTAVMPLVKERND